MTAFVAPGPARHATAADSPPPIRYIKVANSTKSGAGAVRASVAQIVAEADAAFAAGNDVSALKAYERALALQPHNRAARNGRLLTMSRLGAPAAALAEAKRDANADPDVIQRLYEDEAALAIRRTEQVHRTLPIEARADADNALRLIEANRKRYPHSERTRFDYVRALSNRGRHGEAVAHYEQLIREKRDLPAYLHGAAGNSYLALENPDAAATAFRTAIRRDANDFNANVGLFYALSDLTEYDAAQTHISAFAARPLPPEQKFAAEIHAAWAHAFANRLSRAQTEFAALETRAPASAHIRNALGTVYLWRGWPRRAVDEHTLAAQADNTDIGASVGLAHAEIALGDFKSAGERVTLLTTLAPDVRAVKQASRALAVRELHELHIASGSSTKDRLSQGQSVSVDARLYSRPLGFQHRVFARTHYEQARFAEGRAYAKRLGVGIESTIARHARVEAEVQQEFFRRDRTSGAIGGTLDLNDFWRMHARFDSNSTDVPLQARLVDVSGRATQAGLRYRHDDRTSADVGAHTLAMSDTNTRRRGFFAARHKLIEGAFYQATAGIEIGASSNTLDNAAYFNPQRDRSWQFVVANEWLGYRRYTRAFYQRLQFAGGRYAQHNFDSKGIASARYEHDWSFSDTASLRYGLGYAQRAFDGIVSKGPEASLDFNWKF